MTATPQTVANRLNWWNQHPPQHGYSQTLYAAGADGRSYRTDCSGYVSMLTGMAGSPDTAAIVADKDLSQPITKDQLQFGDVLIVPPTGGRGGHVVLFDRWLDDEHTSYYGHEFGHGRAPLHHAIDYPYRDGDGRDFKPRRLLAVVRDATPAPHPTVPGTDPGQPAQPLPVPEFPGLVRSGDRGDAVKAVQARLIARGWSSVARAGGADGIAGPATIAAVRAFQQEKGLAVDGIVGPATWRALWILPIS